MKTPKSSKAIEILIKFEDSDWKLFVKWLNSIWFNSNKKLVELLAVLKNYQSKFDDPKLTREEIFKKLYKGKKFSAGVMDNLFSELNQQLEQFLIFQQFEKSKHQKKFFLSQALQEKGLEKRFLKTNESSTKALEKITLKTWEEQVILTQLRRQLYHHPNQTLRMSSSRNLLLSELDQSLELTFLLQKAININEKIFRNRILKDTCFEVKIEIENWLKNSEKHRHPSINLFKQRFQYSEKNLLNQYFNLKEDFLSNYDKMDKMDQQIHLLSLINDSSDLRKRGWIDLSETLPLFKLGLASGILIEKGVIDPIVYGMILSASNLKKDFEFSEHFIDTYSKNLPKNAIEDGMQYAKAHTANKKKELEICLDLISQYDFTHQYFQLVSKTLTLQTYFDLLLGERSYESYFNNFCNSFEKWIRREKIRSIANKEPFINFILKTRALMRLFLEPDFDEKATQKILEGEINLNPINWLFEKRDEIIQLRKNGRSLVGR